VEGVEDLDEAGLGFAVGVDDSAVILVMILMQQGIDGVDEGDYLFPCQWLLRLRFTDGIDIPAGVRLGAHRLPEVIQLRPAENTGEAAAEGSVKRVRCGGGQGHVVGPV